MRILTRMICAAMSMCLFCTLLPMPGHAEQTEIPVLKDLFAEDFRFGVACEAISHWNNRLSEIGNPSKEALISSQFNSITFGNELKPEYNMVFYSREATETNLPFRPNRAAVEMLEWAKANQMPVRGHTLIWHSQCSDAIFCKNYKAVYGTSGLLSPDCLVDSETMLARMESYIYSVMEYVYANGYGDVIYAWDVVNEAIEPGKNPYNMRDSYWYRTIGPEFLSEAFRFAREASVKYSIEYAGLYGIDPEDEEALSTIQPKLFYNDYNEYMPAKRDAIIRAVTPIYEAGNLDGIGMQGHLSDTSDIDAFITALHMYSEAVGEVHITELDVMESSSGVNADYQQGVFYNRLFTALLQAKQDGANLTGVTVWGLTDDNSWKKEASPLLFRGDLSTKPAFEGIVNAHYGQSMPKPDYTAPDLSDGIFTFDTTVGDLYNQGFSVQGSGSLEVQRKTAKSGNALCLNSRKQSSDGISLDVSRFAGQTVYLHAWVRSEDPEITLTGLEPAATVQTVARGWAELSITGRIPQEGGTLTLVSDGTADLCLDDLTVRLVGLLENFEAQEHVLKPRGDGHVPQLSVVSNPVYSGARALRVSRSAQEATVQLDVSPYVGRIVEVSAMVRTDDAHAVIGLVGQEDQSSEFACTAGEWTELRKTLLIPANARTSQIYIETDGTADYYLDDVAVRIGEFTADFESDELQVSPRWQGAGSIRIVEEGEGHAAVLTDRAEAYYGISFDVTPYLGMLVEISFDVKTEDKTVKLAGEIDGQWPNYLTTSSAAEGWKTAKTTVRLPDDLSALRLYIETNGKSDLYIDNLCIRRTGVK